MRLLLVAVPITQLVLASLIAPLGHISSYLILLLVCHGADDTRRLLHYFSAGALLLLPGGSVMLTIGVP